MDLITESVKQIETLAEHGGCAGAGVLLDVDPREIPCQFEQGTVMSAAFGGRSAVFTTWDPIRAMTKISYMFGAPLDTPPVRGAACAIINVVLGFLCMSRVLHPCQESCHASCRDNLGREIAGKKIFCIGSLSKREHEFSPSFVAGPADADIILVTADGLIAEGTGDIIEEYGKDRRIISIGPSTAGVARLREFGHWCPHGRSAPDKPS